MPDSSYDSDLLRKQMHELRSISNSVGHLAKWVKISAVVSAILTLVVLLTGLAIVSRL